MKSDIAELISYQKFPVISAVISLGLARADNETKIRRVLAEALSLIPKALLRVDREIFLARLELMLQELAAAGHPKSVAIFVGKEITRIMPLNFTAQDRLVIDRTCAVMEVVYSKTMFPLFNVIVLSGNDARVFKGVGDHLVEIKHCQLVSHLSHLLKHHVDVIKTTQSEKVNSANTTSCSALQLNAAFLALIKNLDHPAIVIGLDRIGAFSQEMLKFIAGSADGDFDYVSNAEIGRLAEEIASKWVTRKMQNERSAIDRYKHCKKLGSGAVEIKTLIEHGRVDKLYLEDLQTAGLAQSNSHKLTVQDLLLSLALKSDGQVLFMPPGSLSEYEGMAAGLRY